MSRRIFLAAVLGIACAIAPVIAEAQYYGTTNVAKGKPVIAHTPTAIGGPPSVITDGRSDPSDLGTRWFSYFTQEYTIDLGTPIPIGKIVVFVSQASRIVISSSLDGVTFETRHGLDTTDAQHSNWIGAMAQGALVFEANGTYSARYLKYRSDAVGCGCYQGTYEFAVYEWVSTPPPVLSGDNLATLPGRLVTDLLASASPPANVADGNPGTSWIGAYWGAYTGMAGRQMFTTLGYAEIDLGSELVVHGVRVRRPLEGGAQTASVSLFDSTHAEIGWVGDGDPSVVGTDNPVYGDVDFVLDVPVQARYVRIVQWNPTVSSPSVRPALAEVEVYGEVDLIPQVQEVSIDIKPGSFPNSINPRSKGKIPVAILTTDTFDATTVDETTVLFGPTGSEAAPVQVALEDVDGDLDTDMILHFNTQETGIVCGDTSASLTGQTFSGQAIEGSDSISTVGCK